MNVTVGFTDITNVTLLMTRSFIDPNNTAVGRAPFRQINTTEQVTRFLVLILCILGILGNLLNLVVLTRKQLQTSMDHLEKGAHLGLVTLAVSDLLFCVVQCPKFFVKRTTIVGADQNLFPFYYDLYHSAVINTFLFSSTWLTVLMASTRYFAICHPLHARTFLSLRGTKIATVCVFLGSVVVNLPRFWENKANKGLCPRMIKSDACYTQLSGFLRLNKTIKLGYTFLWAILGVFIPLVILAFCNFCLIRALHQSSRMQRRYRANQPRDSGYRITPTLITIVIMFMILVCPSEIFLFYTQVGQYSKNPQSFRNNKAVFLILNLLQTVNFTINFVLYCAINAHFRNTVKSILCCVWLRRSDYSKANSQHTLSMNLSEMDTELQ